MKRRIIAVFFTLTLALLTGLAAQPVAAQSTTWTAEYFNNTSLAGPPMRWQSSRRSRVAAVSRASSAG